jgi:predicted dehydrogenase/threonine dehydrogenase-like Zn-dependent dehydrogenase
VKQIIQDLQSGNTILEEVPVPAIRRGCILIKTQHSLVSLGTEKMLVEFGKANIFQKVKQQPEKVKQVFDKIKADGLMPTLEAVFRKLGEPLPLGYCNAGEVIEIGEGVTDFKIGDRVISNGCHAEVVCVPKNLVAKIPDSVSYEEASFTVIGAIGLQGIRLLNPTFGERIVVIGLGLIGLITAELLYANGCEVIGFDFDQSKVDIAKRKGIKAYNIADGSNPVPIVLDLTDGVGADGVLITASTKSNEVISQAAQMSRKRGRIVLVGVIGLEMKRAEFYEKELTFQVSCSYGPGRYDDGYEQRGNDYPIGFVRWTEKRNFEAILQAIATKRLDVQPLITEVIDLEHYNQIYGSMAGSKSIASILKYSGKVNMQSSKVAIGNRNFSGQKGVLGLIGAGNFTGATVLPAMKKINANIKYITSASGLSSTTLAKKFGINYASTNYQDVLQDNEVDAVLITTRHNQHAQQVIEALQANKHVFVEKPLALTLDELEEIKKVYKQSNKTLTVGFNRRFSPFIQDAKKQLGNSNTPINVIATMNAGFIPANSWVHDLKVGGGRIIGEACHLIDLITYLTGSLVESVVMNAMGANPEENTDNANIILRYKNGSTGVINYFSNGHKSYSKERIEIYSQNRTIVIDNFRKSEYFGFKSSGLSKGQDKGHEEQFRKFVEQLKQGGSVIIPFDEIMNTSKAAIGAVISMKTGQWFQVNE